MSEALALSALLCWQAVMMGALRASSLSPPGTRRLLFASLGFFGFIVSCTVAARTWPATVAFWWWLLAWIGAALAVVWAHAYLRHHRRAAPAALLGLGIAGGLAIWGLA